MKLDSKALGDTGEAHSLELLAANGFSASRLPTNAPTYDLRACRSGIDFLVSVKVSREKQHVRLGARSSVDRLGAGNFVFAFMPRQGSDVTSFDPARYRLLILPAEIVKADALRVHDAYWANKGSADEYSVIVKGYGNNHREIWPKWLRFTDAWHVLPG